MQDRRPLTVLALGGILMTAALTAQGLSDHFRSSAHGMGGRAGFGPPPHMLQQYLQLSDSQKTASQSLHQALRESVHPLFAQSRQLHDQIRQALQAQNADAAMIGRLMISAHAIRQQIKTAHDNYEKSFAALLSPEQAARYNTLQEVWKVMRTSRPEPPGQD